MEAHDAERRQLTVMFCDIVESTALAARLDPEDLRDVVRAYQDAVAGAVQRFHGHVAQYLGDGLLVYFGWPHAHDDDAPRAVHAALAVLDAVHALDARMASAGGPHIDVRIGVHTGPVVVGDVGAGGRVERLAVGDAPNVAARLQEAAAPGTILVSAATAELLEERFFLEDRGAPALQGVGDPVRAYQVLGETGIRSRFDLAAQARLLPLVGRDAELARLVGLWECARNGAGRVVLVSGEPGIGKSRLLQALKAHVSATGGRWGSMRCSPYFSSTPLYPVTELWHQAMTFAGATTPPDRLAWLERQLASHGFDLPVAVPLFADLLGVPVPEGRHPPLALDADARREHAIEGVLTITLNLARRRPYLLIFEDLQWVDPTTAEVLRSLADRVAEHAILAVYTSRSRIEHACVGGHVVDMELGRLEDLAVDAMLAHLAGDRALPPDVARVIRERAEGVPGVVEELCRHVLERSEGGMPAAAAAAQIPASLHDSLMARLDRTGDAKQLAMLCATIGRWFSHALVEAIAGLPAAQLEAGLQRLVEARVLTRDGTPPDATYSFRHALMQELAYEALLRRARRRYHAAIADAIETRFPDLGDRHPELLAHHHARAGNVERAVALLRRAAASASARSAHAEAQAHLAAAEALARDASDTRDR